MFIKKLFTTHPLVHLTLFQSDNILNILEILLPLKNRGFKFDTWPAASVELIL